MPTTLHGNNDFDKGCLRNKINILRDVVMELKVVYLNFDIVGETLVVQTLHHPGLDHKGVLYRIRGTLALRR